VLECIKLLQTASTLPIQRARMRVRVTVPTVDIEQLKKRILEGAEKIENEDTSQEDWVAVSLLCH
jgi:ribosome maturation protein SDO1